jgi:hypothetical protein
MSDMQNISTENLHIGHLEVCDTIDDDVASIIFLTAGFCVEARAIEKDAECRIFRDTRC